MVERIKIQSNSIIIRNSSNNITFDTANPYIKTASDGVLQVGGFTKFPITLSEIATNYTINEDQPNEVWLEYKSINYASTRINTTINLGVLPPFTSLMLVPQQYDPNSVNLDYYYGPAFTCTFTNVRIDNVIVGQGQWTGVAGGPFDSGDYLGLIGYVTEFAVSLPSNRIGGTVTIDATTGILDGGYSAYGPATIANVIANPLPANSGAHRVLIQQPAVNLALKVTA